MAGFRPNSDIKRGYLKLAQSLFHVDVFKPIKASKIPVGHLV